MTHTDPFRCICQLDPPDLIHGIPRATEGCPAHLYRYAFQQVARRIFPCCDLHNIHCELPGDLCCTECTKRAHDTFPIRHADGTPCVLEDL